MVPLAVCAAPPSTLTFTDASDALPDDAVPLTVSEAATVAPFDGLAMATDGGVPVEPECDGLAARLAAGASAAAPASSATAVRARTVIAGFRIGRGALPGRPKPARM